MVLELIAVQEQAPFERQEGPQEEDTGPFYTQGLVLGQSKSFR